MTIKKTPSTLPRRKLKTTYTKKVSSKTKKILNKKWKNWFFKIMIYIIVFFLIGWIILGAILYQKYIVGLPPVSELKNLKIAESSIIYDRNWEELYKIFKEKRTYVNYEDINKNMINAIVSIEDKRYWTNPWIDIRWLIRAWFNYILWNSDWVAGTSTLTQQLIRNTIITNERSLERKIKEIYLAYKLTNSLSKEKILELYLNKISYWHNAYGIEEWAKTFFNKSAKNLNVFESSILASLPKWPTYYSPYNHPWRIVWYPYIYAKETPSDIVKIITKKDVILNNDIVKKFTHFIAWLKASRLEWTNKILICNIKKEYFKNEIRVDNDWCSVIEYPNLIPLLNSIRIKDSNDNYIEYETWRKDRVLWRMLEDWYITFKDYQNSILTGIWYKFNQSREEIKAPHFVFFVKEYLEEKYWEKLVNIGWLKIYTTLDLKLQEKAQQLVEDQAKINETKFWANNAALISLDNKTGEILSMVWSKDYFDKDNKWNVNIITSKLQPWSTFKPFVYSMWIFNKKIWSKSVIFDLKTDFWSDYIPANFDGKFMWKMNISTALNNSRNIPAIKMFFMAWWEKSIVNFMKKMWVNSLNSRWQYWAPLALWTWEMTPLELATAYSTFANMWIKKDITPILRIEDSKWNIIEEHKEKEYPQTISKNQAYIMNHILSDSTTRPTFWNTYMTLPDRKLSAKTWTSTKQYIRNGKKDIYPANLWTIWYTPQITTVVWAWNTDWSKLGYRWNWLEWAWPIMQKFMAFAHKGLPIEDWTKPDWVKKINISKVSWLLPNPENVNSSNIIKSLFINVPNTYDNSFRYVKVDSLCNWAITDRTPDAAIKTVRLLSFHSLMPNNPKWENPVINWTKSPEFQKIYWNSSNIIWKINPPCERSSIPSEIIIKTTIKDNEVMHLWENFVLFAYRSSNPIIKVEVFIWDTLVDQVKINNKKNWSYSWKIFIPATKLTKSTKLILKAIDNQYYSSTVEKHISIRRK